jgi:hypothetical protein
MPGLDVRVVKGWSNDRLRRRNALPVARSLAPIDDVACEVGLCIGLPI